MRSTLDQLIEAAALAGVKLGIEPEPANVVSDASAASRLIDELGDASQHIGIVLDPANLLTPATLRIQESLLSEAFEGLGPHVICVHAKDVVERGFAAPGEGGLDFELVYRLCSTLPQPVPVVIQDTDEADARTVRLHLEHLAMSRPWQDVR